MKQQQQLWSRLSSNQGIAIWLHITRVFPIELSIPRLARDECRDWRFMSLRSLVSVEVFEVDSILTNLHRGTKLYETPCLHCRHFWSSHHGHHGRSSVHRPAASAPLPDSSSFFQQRPISVYNTPVQDCLWDAGLLRAASAMDLQSRTLKSTQWAETKKYHNIAGPGNFTNYKTYLKNSMEEN